MMQTVTIAEHSDLLPVQRDRQRDGFPPNFVHSLDATHMYLTAIDCMYCSTLPTTSQPGAESLLFLDDMTLQEEQRNYIRQCA